ncbi:chromate transporter, partial [bacterium]|nr:chromate transporter [bacterium]
MLKVYFLLYYEFLKIGVFAIGGGYAALPFLFYIQSKYNWFSIDELTNMIAVSAITPGPVGINMATYTGFTTGGIIGALISTCAIVTLPFLCVITVIKILNKF